MFQKFPNGVFVESWWNLGNADRLHDFLDVSRCHCACQEQFDIINGFCTNIDQGHCQSEFQSINDNNEGEWNLCDDGNDDQYHTDGAIFHNVLLKLVVSGIPPDFGAICFRGDRSDADAVTVLPDDHDLNVADSNTANLAVAISVRP